MGEQNKNKPNYTWRKTKEAKFTPFLRRKSEKIFSNPSPKRNGNRTEIRLTIHKEKPTDKNRLDQRKMITDDGVLKRTGEFIPQIMHPKYLKTLVLKITHISKLSVHPGGRKLYYIF